MNTLPLIWAGIVAFAILMYVLLDGFDLGIGILFPWINDKTQRDIMMNTVAPVWDGNETWMVFGGATLYGAFPLAYSTLMPALYMPITLMLAALIFRGVAFEFRFKAHRSLWVWDIAFTVGSTLAAFAQGVILGTIISGYLTNISGYYAWLTPFSITTGIALVIGYGLLGATWLIIKTEGELQNTMYNAAKVLLFGIAFFLVIVSLWTPFIDPAIKQRWFSLPNFYYLSVLPLLTLITWGYAFYTLTKRHEKSPFILSVLLFLFSYAGLGISCWPYLVPRTITIWQAASDSKSLSFLLVGAIILLPVLIGYSIYAYIVFRGKVKVGHGYH